MSEETTKDVPMLPDGCGYMGHEFGSPYLDSQCFGGRLYDLDNGEAGILYEPNEYLPCPNCRMEEWLEREAEDVSTSINGWAKSSLPQWKAVCRHALKTNRDEALRLLNGKFKTAKYLANNAAGDDFDDREWVFSEGELVAEEAP